MSRFAPVFSRFVPALALLALTSACGGDVDELPDASSQSALSTEPKVDGEQTVAITQLEGEAAPAAAAKTVRTYKMLWGTKQYTWYGNFRLSNRVAAQVAYDNGKPVYVRPYGYVRTEYHHWASQGIPEYYSPVVFGVSDAVLRIADGGDKPFQTTNSGSDGLYTEYGGWVSTEPGCWNWYVGLQTSKVVFGNIPVTFLGHHTGVPSSALIAGLCR